MKFSVYENKRACNKCCHHWPHMEFPQGAPRPEAQTLWKLLGLQLPSVYLSPQNILLLGLLECWPQGSLQILRKIARIQIIFILSTTKKRLLWKIFRKCRSWVLNSWNKHLIHLNNISWLNTIIALMTKPHCYMIICSSVGQMFTEIPNTHFSTAINKPVEY